MSLDDAIDSLTHYKETGRQLGHFLTAVIENDLFEAIGRADESSLDNLRPICRYVWNHLPAPCCGSPEKVAAWQAAKRAEREDTP